jgi:hypothetical protein
MATLATKLSFATSVAIRSLDAKIEGTMTRVLIFHASVGAGHKSAAKALARAGQPQAALKVARSVLEDRG